MGRCARELLENEVKKGAPHPPVKRGDPIAEGVIGKYYPETKSKYEGWDVLFDHPDDMSTFSSVLMANSCICCARRSNSCATRAATRSTLEPAPTATGPVHKLANRGSAYAGYR